MTPDLPVKLAVVLLTILAVGLVVGVHYEGLNWLGRRVLHGVVGALLLQVK